MKKITIITALLALATITVQGQELKMNEPSVSDYLPLLKVKGYMAYSFDTNIFKGKQVEPIIKEYADGKEVGRPAFWPPFKVGEFIPLVLYGSYWYDKNCNGHRFCGERLIKPDLTSEILKNIPHYYVLGIQVKE